MLSHPAATVRAMVDLEDVRRVASELPRTSEHLIHDRVTFRCGRLVYVRVSRDERSMGFGCPREEREALVAAQPETFFLPAPSDMKYQWVRVWLGAIDRAELRELVTDAWRLVVPRRFAEAHLGS